MHGLHRPTASTAQALESSPVNNGLHNSGDLLMKIQTIGVMSPGDMGQAIALQLKNHGFKVCTALDARSARSKTLAREAGLTDVGTLGALTEQCEVILSVMNPGAALSFADEIAHALE